jgi:hypothetical protein
MAIIAKFPRNLFVDSFKKMPDQVSLPRHQPLLTIKIEANFSCKRVTAKKEA